MHPLITLLYPNAELVCRIKVYISSFFTISDYKKIIQYPTGSAEHGIAENIQIEICL